VRLIDWLWRRRREDDLQDEIHAHLSMATRDRIEDGLDPRAARLAAIKQFGNVTRTRETTRATWHGGWRICLLDLGQDLRFSLRSLTRSPGYVLIVTAVLALGVGANVAVFSVLRPLALQPIAGVDGAARLGVLVAKTGAGRILPLSHLDFRDLVQTQDAFAELTGTSLESFSLGLGASGERIWAEQVTGNYFQVLGIGAQLGRTLLPSDDVAPGTHPVVVISDGIWKRAFGADPAIVGRRVLISGYPMTIVGVTEPSFRGSVVSMDVEAFIPVMMQPQLQGRDDLSVRHAPKLWGLGRLRPGMTIEAAAAQAGVLSARLRKLHPQDDVEQFATVLPIWQSPFGAQTYMLPALVLLSAMALLVLLIVCANVSNLVLVRGVGRRGEIAARLALGASRARVLRLLFVESMLLALPGALAGVLASRVLLQAMNTTSVGQAAPGRMYLDFSIEGLVVSFALVLSCGSALVFGLLPAWHVSRVDLTTIMRDDLSPRSGPRARLRGALVVSQVAVSLVLLVGAALVLRSLGAARHADPGFDASGIASVSLDLQASGYDQSRGHAFYRNLLDALRAEPGIESATLAVQTPMALVPGRTREVEIEGYAPAPADDLRFLINAVATDYFAMLRIAVLAGRDFARSDTAATRRVVIVNETLARRFWGSPQGAVGQRLRMARGEWAVVTGVVRDVKYLRLDEEPRPFVYLPFEQYALAPMFIHARGGAPMPALLEQVRARVRSMDANLPILDSRPLTEQTQLGLGVLAMAAGVLAVIGAIAVLLAALGTYGTIAYTVKQSEHEIGVRMAVGAGRRQVVERFFGRGLRLGLCGAAIGVAASLAVSRALASLLYGVSGMDPVSITSAMAVLLIAVCASSLAPAWRAARIDPAVALRRR
jgi:predicted permease